MNKPTSLTASVCSLCITASLVAVPPQAAAAELPAVQHRTISAIDLPYDLTAASTDLQQLLIVAGLPFDNAYKTVNAIVNLAVFIQGANQALGAVYKGQWDKIPAALTKAVNDEMAAIQTFINLPQDLITYDIEQISKLVGGVSPLPAARTSVGAAALPTATATIDDAQQLLIVAGLPFDNAYKTVNAIVNLAVFIQGANQALGAVYKGQWDKIPAALTKAVNDEVAAIQTFINLPQDLITYDIEQISKLVGGVAPAPTTATFDQSTRVQTLALAAAPQTEGSTPTTAAEVPTTGTEALDAGNDAKDTKSKGVTETTGTTGTTEASGAKGEAGTETDGTTGKTDTSGSTAGTSTDEKSGDTTGTAKHPKSGKHTTQGKHARQDDTAGATSSTSAGVSSMESSPGKHRKPAARSDGSSAPSADRSTAAAA